MDEEEYFLLDDKSNKKKRIQNQKNIIIIILLALVSLFVTYILTVRILDYYESQKDIKYDEIIYEINGGKFIDFINNNIDNIDNNYYNMDLNYDYDNEENMNNQNDENDINENDFTGSINDNNNENTIIGSNDDNENEIAINENNVNGDQHESIINGKENNKNNDKDKEYNKMEGSYDENMKNSNSEMIINNNDNINKNKVDLDNFMLLNRKNRKGPITLNRENDDGSKLNIYSMIINSDENKIYTYDNTVVDFQLMEPVLRLREEFLCDYRDDMPPESYYGYSLSCPLHYTISINDTFYGRREYDSIHCTRFPNGDEVPIGDLVAYSDCGENKTELVKELCEGKRECVLKPSKHIFGETCFYYRYLQVKYHCVKDKIFKNQQIAIVTFADKIKENSVYENSISEFYQYSKIHGYQFLLKRNKYDYTRDTLYMKLYSLLEIMLDGLKNNKYDWIFWVDSDTIIGNPNIKLESFLPENDNIHFIASNDSNGLSTGVFFLRVHPWSLNFLNRALSYSYFNIKKSQRYSEQTSINNVLLESDEQEHYTIVPQDWFNSYLSNKNKGDFIIHLAGEDEKDEKAKEVRLEIKKMKWYKYKTNKEMRREVRYYYSLPKNKQHKLKMK